MITKTKQDSLPGLDWVYTCEYLPTGTKTGRVFTGSRRAFLEALARWNAQQPGTWNYREGAPA